MFERICWILLANLIFFSKTLGFKYVSDDIPAKERGKDPNRFRHWMLVLEGHLRSSEQIDHAITTLIHAIVCVFIYIGFGANDISFLAAFLFAFNPANNQASVWIAGRSYALSALGMVGSFAIPNFAVPMILLATYYNPGYFGALITAIAQPINLMVLPVCWLVHKDRILGNVKRKIDMEMFHEDKQIKPQKLILFTKTFGFYFTHALIPLRTTFYHSFLESLAGSKKHLGYTIKDRFFWIGLVAMISIGIYLFAVKWNMISYGLLWFCFTIAPFCNLFRLHQEIAERYMYVPNVGLMMALAAAIYQIPYIWPFFLGMYATKMWFYMNAYKDDYYLVEYAHMNAPNSWFALHIRALHRWEAQSYKEAIIFWTMARILSPKEFKIYVNLATCLMMLNKREEAFKFMDIAKNNIPKGQEPKVQNIIDDWYKGQCHILI